MNSSAQIVSITEFIQITQLSEREVLSMLEHGELSFHADDTGALLIDISSLNANDIAKREASKRSAIDDTQKAEIEEIVASELVHSLEPMIDEALELALNWAQQKDKPSS